MKQKQEEIRGSIYEFQHQNAKNIRKKKKIEKCKNISQNLLKYVLIEATIIIQPICTVLSKQFIQSKLRKYNLMQKLILKTI